MMLAPYRTTHRQFENALGLKRLRLAQRGPFVLTACIALQSLFVQSLSAQEDSANSNKESVVNLMHLSLKELLNVEVTTLSRSAENKDLAPGVVYTFDAKLIQERGYKSLTDLLVVIPGFTVFLKGTGIVAGVRGLNSVDNEKVTLLINGRESNNLQEPEFLNGPINLQNLERVEVVVGPSSFFQRANTLAATINIITKKIDGTEVIVSTGSDTPYSVTALLGKRWNTGDFVTGSFIVERKDGYDAWDELNRAGLENTTLTGRLDPSIFATLEGQIGHIWGQVIVYRSNAPELNLATKGNDATYKDHMTLFNVIHTLPINKDLTLKSSFDIGDKLTRRLNDDGPTINNALEVEYSQIDYSGEFAFEFTGNEYHIINIGFQWAYEDNREFFATVDNVYSTLVDEDEDTHALGLYVYDDWQIRDSFTIKGGLRIDYNSVLSDSNVNWGARVASIYQPENNWTTKLIANRAVRYPSPIAALNQAWGADKPDAPSFANRNLPPQKPEILSTLEWQNILYFESTHLSINIYYQDLTDFITWNGPHTNAGDYAGYGLELDLHQNISDKFNLWANAAFVDSDFESVTEGTITGSGGGSISIDDDNKILGSPSITANTGFDYKINDSLTVNGQVRYFTDQAAFSREDDAFEKIDNRYYVDATATFRDFLKNGFDISLSGQNILDNKRQVSTQWRKSQNRPRGRSLLLTLQARF